MYICVFFQECSASERYAIPSEETKQKLPELLQPETPGPTRTALHSNEDMNGHINNVAYMMWAMDTIPTDVHNSRCLTEVRMHYSIKKVWETVLVGKHSTTYVGGVRPEAKGIMHATNHQKRILSGIFKLFYSSMSKSESRMYHSKKCYKKYYSPGVHLSKFCPVWIIYLILQEACVLSIFEAYLACLVCNHLCVLYLPLCYIRSTTVEDSNTSIIC